MKRIIRVFPYRTSYTPDDDMVYIGLPDMLIPYHDEVHISCIFTWDRRYCRWLYYQWQGFTDKPVLLGGVAFGSEVKGFVQGMYLKSNVIFTSRGCNNKCGFCAVPNVEGKLHELPICKGNIIQDNNFLQCSIEHKNNVFKMLEGQKAICFKGGLETRLLDDHFINGIADLRIKELWLACDNDKALDPLADALKDLHKAGFNKNKIYCYSLIGDDMVKNEARLQKIFKLGAMPFAQLYQHFEDEKIKYSRQWKQFARQWQRPAAIISHCVNGTHYSDY